MGCEGKALDLKALALGLHTSAFGLYERAVLGWLLLACDESAVWLGRMRELADGACLGLTKLKGVLGDLESAGVVTRWKVDGGVQIGLDAGALADVLATPSAVSRPTISRHATDHEPPRDRWVVATRPMGGRHATHLVRAGVTDHPSGTSYPPGGGVVVDREARDPSPVAPPRQPATTTTLCQGQVDGLEPGELYEVVSRWAEARGVIPMQVTAREESTLRAHLKAHGLALVTAAIASLSDYSKRTGKPLVLAWLPDRIKQARQDAAKAQGAAVDYKARPDGPVGPVVEYRAYPEGAVGPRVDYSAGEAHWTAQKWGES